MACGLNIRSLDHGSYVRRKVRQRYGGVRLSRIDGLRVVAGQGLGKFLDCVVIHRDTQAQTTQPQTCRQNEWIQVNIPEAT